MNKNILNVTTVAEYNEMLGVETLHPMVSVIDLSKAKPCGTCATRSVSIPYSSKTRKIVS